MTAAIFCKFCGDPFSPAPKHDPLNRLCPACRDYHRDQSPSGGRAAGAVFEIEKEDEELMAFAVGGS